MVNVLYWQVVRYAFEKCTFNHSKSKEWQICKGVFSGAIDYVLSGFEPATPRTIMLPDAAVTIQGKNFTHTSQLTTRLFSEGLFSQYSCYTVHNIDFKNQKIISNLNKCLYQILFF